MATMTRKEMFALIKEEMAGNPEVVEFCEKQIAALSKPRVTKPKPEVAERKAAIATWLADQPEEGVTQAMASEALGMTPGQAGAALRALVEAGIAHVVEGKKGECKRYAVNA